MSKHLWVNLTDLMYPALQMPLVGGVLPLFINDDLGDRRLPGGYYKSSGVGRIDDMFIVIKCADSSRPQAIAAALELIGKEKLGRKIRTRITAGPPTSAWAARY